MINKETEFYNALKLSGLRKNGWDLLILYAQFCLESGYGSNELVREANNPFSVKAGTTWKGDVYLLKDNPEVINGKEVIIPDVFRKYPSLIDAIISQDEFIQRRFPHSYEKRGTYNEYFYNLINGEPYKYATGPLYVEHSISIYDRLANQNNGEFKFMLNEVKGE